MKPDPARLRVCDGRRVPRLVSKTILPTQILPAISRLISVPMSVLVAVLVLAGSSPARADADDWQVSGHAGIASVVVEGRDPLGLRLGLGGQYGLDDAWAVRMTASASRHGVSEDSARALPGGTIYAYSAFAGFSYTLDVLRLLPTFELGLGILGVTGAVARPHRAIGMQAAIGAEYLVGPRFSVGAVAEYVFAPFDLISNALSGNAVPQAFALCARASWIIH
jgi:hypothetical protein